MTAPEIFKLKEEVRKYFINKQKDGRVSLDFNEFYAWVKYGFAKGNTSKNTNLTLQVAEKGKT